MHLSAVSYLNTKPFIYGLLRSDLATELDISLDIPSECARKLKSGEVELALTPIAILPELPTWHLVSDYCIGADGRVQTVCIYSQVPIEAVEEIYLDFHSRSSVALTRVLVRDYWNIQPRFLPTTEGYQQDIRGTRAGLIIGDRAIGMEKQFPYTYDLAEIWKKATGLPFVFAAWVSLKPLEESFVQRFNAALANGISLIPELVKVLPTMPNFDVEQYFKTAISYPLDDSKRQALALFLDLMQENGVLPVREEKQV